MNIQSEIEKKIIDILYTWLHNRDSYTKELPPMPISALTTLVEGAYKKGFTAGRVQTAKTFNALDELKAKLK